MESTKEFPFKEVLEHLRSIAERFVEYAKLDTQSDDTSETSPSTEKQHVLADLLVKQLKDMGVKDVQKTDKCVVLGTVEGVGCEKDTPTLCLISHIDVALECSAANISPQLIKEYHVGEDLTYTKDIGEKIVLTTYNSCKEDLDLCDKNTIITTDGTTLLGGDDKAGVTAIMEAIKEIIEDKTRKHCRVRVCFTPDEEVGRGAENLTKELLDADFAVTVDGGSLGEYSWETFNAVNINVTFKGHAVHPGEAYGKLASAVRVASTFVNMIPEEWECYFTKEREGYIHVIDLSGNSEKATVSLLLRSFDSSEVKRFEEEINKFAKMAIEKHYKSLSSLGYCSDKCDEVFNYAVEKKRGYHNMGEFMQKLKNGMKFVDDVIATSMKQAGVVPRCIPIRGGTDGIAVTELGIPCPNIFTGTSNMHSISEFVSLNAIEKAKETIVNMTENMLHLK